MADVLVHHLERSRSHRVLWLLEELEVPYRIQVWKRGRDMRAPPELRAIHPLGLAPVVQVDGAVLVESGAIIDALLDRFGDGRMRPKDGHELDMYRFWLHYAEGSVMPPLLVKLLTNQLRKGAPWPASVVTRAIAGRLDALYTDPQIARHLDFVERHLEDREWLVSELSGADVQMSYPLLAAVGRAAADRPAIRAFLDRCEARPAWQRAVEKGGPPLLA
ncbi:MAG: glutathione S-transferase [Myxococcales bacterium]|nr:glutathione S-transferase [Myxococcales bacterium]